MRATNLTQLPNYSVVWYPASEHSATLGIPDVVCELFHWSAEALVWAEERVKQLGGGAVVFGAEAGSVVVVGTFGTLPDQLRSELVACATPEGPQHSCAANDVKALSRSTGRVC